MRETVSACVASMTALHAHFAPTDVLQSSIRQTGLKTIITSRLFTHKVPIDPGPGVEIIYLDDFRKGIRKNDMMSIVVQQLTDQDVADLAAYYAAIEITMKPPPK